MKQFKIVTLMSLIIGGVFLATSVIAMEPQGQSGPGGPDPKMMGEGPQMFAGLNLSDEQVATLKKSKKAKHRKMIKLHAAMEEAKLDMADELDKPKPDRSKARKIAAKIGELHAEKVLHRAESIIELKAILTPEQLKKLDTMMLMKGGPEGGMGHGMRGRGHKKGRGKGRF